MKLLHLDSSILGEHSSSRVLSREIVARLKAEHPGLSVTYQDLAAEPLPHYSAASLAVPTASTPRGIGRRWRPSWRQISS